MLSDVRRLSSHASPLTEWPFLKLDRRAFLGSLALALPACVRRDGPRVAVVGVGGYGSRHIEKLIAAGARVVAIADVDPNASARALASLDALAAPRPRVERDFRRLLDDRDVDAVTFATPDHWHALGALWALDAGKHVYLEPPLGRTVSEAATVARAAERSGRVFATGLALRGTGATREALRYVRSGSLGEVSSARIVMRPRRPVLDGSRSAIPRGLDYEMWLGPSPRHAPRRERFHEDWAWFWDYGRGGLGGAGWHRADVAMLGLGVETVDGEVHAVGGCLGPACAAETPDTLFASVGAGDRTIYLDLVDQRAGDGPPPPGGVVFTGSEGRVVIRDHKAELYDRRGHAVGSFVGTDIDPFRLFVGCIANGQPFPTGGRTGLAVTSIVELAMASYRLGVQGPADEILSRNQRLVGRTVLRHAIGGQSLTDGARLQVTHGSLVSTPSPENPVWLADYRPPFAPGPRHT